MRDLPGFVKALCCLLIEPHRNKDALRQTHAHIRRHTVVYMLTHHHRKGGPFLPAQEGMMTLIIASEQDRPQCPYQQSYEVARQLYCIGVP